MSRRASRTKKAFEDELEVHVSATQLLEQMEQLSDQSQMTQQDLIHTINKLSLS
jgi:hypothetical protein